MKILKIEDKKGYFINKNGEYESIEKISKDGLFHLIGSVIDIENTELDDSVSFEIVNPAQKIIYDNLSKKLIEIKAQRETISNNKNKLYLAAIEKYLKNNKGDDY